MSHSSHSPPTGTTEEVETNNKRARREISIAALTTKHKLVLCFTQILGSEVSYSFKFFSIQDLLNDDMKRKLLQPRRELPWPDKEKVDASASADGLGQPYSCISFLHSSTAAAKEEEDDGSGVVYAVGGLSLADNMNRSSDNMNRIIITKSLPDALTRIPLSENSRMLDDDKKSRQMNGGKLFPLIDEIGGLIYVLSGPVTCFDPYFKGDINYFEVYNPGDDTWELLPDPPFISAAEDNGFSPFRGCHEYGHLVFGHILYVSDGLHSCVYDTISKRWNACRLFSGYYLPHPMPFPLAYIKYHADDCGPGFPFISKALPWKDQIFLGLMPDGVPPIFVFRVTTDVYDNEKVVPLQLWYKGGTLLGYGLLPKVVDLGGDHFALMLRQEMDEEWVFDDHVTIFAFKLEIDATIQNRVLVEVLNECYFKPEVEDNYLSYSFAF